MKKGPLFFICAVGLVLSLVATASADVRIKVKKRMSMPGVPGAVTMPSGEVKDPGQLPDSVVLIKGARVRTEARTEKPTPTGMKKIVLAHINQCDLGRVVSFRSDRKKYQATYFNAAGGAAKDAQNKSGGFVTQSVAYTDTGERQQMFGLTARRVKSVTTLIPGPGACQQTSMKIESDAWYVDLPGLSCPGLSAEQTVSGEGSGCSDRINIQIKGKPEYGFALKETKVLTTSGQPPMTITSEAIELTQTELDTVLFDVPEGYEEEKSSSSARTQSAAGGDTRGLDLSADGDSTDIAQSASAAPSAQTIPTTPAAPTAPSATATPLPPKRPGVIRIGVARSVVQTPSSKDDSSDPLDLAIASRETFVAALKGDTVEAVALTSQLPEQEAKQKECDYILHSNVVQKRGGGGMFGNMAAMTALSVAGAFIPGVGGMVAAMATNAVMMSQTMGKTAKPKDEFSLDYRVVAFDSSVLHKGQSKQKVAKQGEDVLTPQIQKAAAAVTAEIKKKSAPPPQN